MSEYACSRQDEQDKPVVTHLKLGECLLFDDTIFIGCQQIPEGMPEAATTFRQPITTDTEPKGDPEPGACLRLDERFRIADAILDYFNDTAKLDGAQKSRTKLTKRYGQPKAEEVLDNMRQKHEVATCHYEERLNRLIGADVLKKAGFSEEDISRVSFAVRHEVNDLHPHVLHDNHSSSRAVRSREMRNRIKNTAEIIKM